MGGVGIVAREEAAPMKTGLQFSGSKKRRRRKEYSDREKKRRAISGVVAGRHRSYTPNCEEVTHLALTESARAVVEEEWVSCYTRVRR